MGWWKLWILGYWAAYSPFERELEFHGPRSGAAWPVVCRLAGRLGATIYQKDDEPFDAGYCLANPGLRKF